VGFVVDKAALGQVFFEYFGFPCQSFHQFLHHNHPGLAQYAYWWPQCRVDPIELHPPLYQLKKTERLAASREGLSSMELITWFKETVIKSWINSIILHGITYLKSWYKPREIMDSDLFGCYGLIEHFSVCRI
jgi:hypothetical protein